MLRNLVQYRKQAYVKKGLFLYYGTAALKKGYGMCFNMGYYTTETNSAGTVIGAVTNKFGARGMKVIEKPTYANAHHFAGVLTQDYPANTYGNAQEVELYLPGGCAEIAIGGVSTVIDTTVVTCSIGPDAGRFTLGGLVGKGSALALQTKAITAITDLAFASLDGTAIEATSGTTYTITKTGIGTACGYGAAVTEDATQYTVVILGGGDDDEVVTPKVVTVLTAPTADTITVSAPSGVTPFIALYVCKDNPTILAYLYDGLESGLVEFVSPSDNVARQHLLLGGVTFVCGGYTMTTGESTSTLADGTYEGARKGFAGLGTLTTHGWTCTVTSGLKTVGTALASEKVDAAGEYAMLRWNGNFGTGTSGLWRSESNTATEA